MRRKDTSITVRISEDMKHAVTRVADAERRSLSQMVAVALEQFLVARNEWPQPDSTAKRSKRSRTSARRS